MDTLTWAHTFTPTQIPYQTRCTYTLIFPHTGLVMPDRTFNSVLVVRVVYAQTCCEFSTGTQTGTFQMVTAKCN